MTCTSMIVPLKNLKTVAVRNELKLTKNALQKRRIYKGSWQGKVTTKSEGKTRYNSNSTGFQEIKSVGNPLRLWTHIERSRY